MDFSVLNGYYGVLMEGTKYTILVSLVSLVVGFVLGLLICLMKMSNFKVLKLLSSAYVQILRGTPLFVQVVIIYFGLPQLGIDFPDIGPISSKFIAGAFALSINSSAYIAEIFRSGIQSVDKGQMEAARSLGMTEAKGMIYIVIPQAIKNILPAIGNEFVAVIKESSMASTIGVAEIMYAVNVVKGATWKSFEPLIVAAICYFTITFTLGRLLGILERRLKASDSR